MTDAPKPKFDPVKLEQLSVAQDYPLEPDEFELLFRAKAYCEMAHDPGVWFGESTKLIEKHMK